MGSLLYSSRTRSVWLTPVCLWSKHSAGEQVSSFTFTASECDSVSPSVPPQYRDFIMICGHTDLRSASWWTKQSQDRKVSEAYLEGAVGHVTDVDDVIRRVAEHPSKPDASEQSFILKIRMMETVCPVLLKYRFFFTFTKNEIWSTLFHCWLFSGLTD